MDTVASRKKTVTKAEIIDTVYVRLGGFSKKEAATALEVILDAIKGALVAGEKVKISGFGSLVVKSKRKRMGRNPKTGKPIEITPRRVLSFKASQVLKRLLNS